MKIPVRRWFFACLVVPGMALLASCSNISTVSDLYAKTASYKVTVIGAAVAAAVYYEDDIVFQVSNETVEPGQFQIIVNKSRFIGGRSGELWSIFKRSAEYIAKREECNGFNILEYTESNEAAFVAGNRVARGTIECKQKLAQGLSVKRSADDERSE